MTHRQAFVPNDLERYDERLGLYYVRTVCGQMIREDDLDSVPSCPDCRDGIARRRAAEEALA